jgi:uncharacterized lipoprotein NlpE involved in copper resistance
MNCEQTLGAAMFKFPALAAACLLAACTAAPAATGAPQADIAQADMAAPAWAGTYAGTLPCADCEGIQIRLTLQPDLHYTLSQTYLRAGGNRSASVSGQFYWPRPHAGRQRRRRTGHAARLPDAGPDSRHGRLQKSRSRNCAVSDG